ncbi:unnamed protein product [Coffea canephora]|uniref:beta-galactosidase n=1 Tax=Coffea canephora TaxID=49390 RepID=A0A068VIE2_COFCA|nr:unnamed protein product [Coffea canephora]
MRGTTTMVLFLFIIVFLSAVLALFATNVTFDHRTLVIDGRWKVLISGAIHYPSSTPQVRAALLSWNQKSKYGGLDVIETYVFWNMHEPVRGQVSSFWLSFQLCFASVEILCCSHYKKIGF